MAKTPLEQMGVEMPEVEPEVQTPPESEPVAAEPERPEWLPDRFKAPEELARAYGELEGRLTREAQTRSTLEAQVSDLREQFEASKQAPPQSDWADQRSQLEEAYESDPLGTMAWLATQAAQQTAQQFVQQTEPSHTEARAQAEMYATVVDQQMGSRHADWHDYRDKVGDLLTEMPHLLPEPANTSPVEAMRYLDTALEIVRNREAAGEPAPTTNDAARRQKLAAQTMAGAAGRSASSGSEEVPLSEAIKRAHQGTSWAAQRSGQ